MEVRDSSRLIRPATTRLAGLIAVVVLSIVLASGAAQAGEPREGIPLPLPEESVWQVVNGYNTVTHAEGDPHALDLMRLDAPGAGTEVLAPVPGRLSYVGESCVSIYDQFGVSHLLCHVTAKEGLARGDRVFAGQVVATIARAGQAENLGFPHLHYALHTGVEALRLVGTIPFTGRYALEGEELADTGAYHGHGDRVFRSSNQRRTAPPGREYLSPGWNLVGWMGSGPLSVPAKPQGAVRSLFTYSAPTQSFLVYSPALPPELNEIRSLRFGDGIWLYVDRPWGAVWEQAPVRRERAVVLSAGMNLVTWTPGSRPVESALEGVPDLIAVYAFDATTQQFHSYRPRGPEALNSLRWLRSGEAVWVEVGAEAVWVEVGAEAVWVQSDPNAEALVWARIRARFEAVASASGSGEAS